jgi:hypothetical protein
LQDAVSHHIARVDNEKQKEKIKFGNIAFLIEEYAPLFCLKAQIGRCFSCPADTTKTSSPTAKSSNIFVFFSDGELLFVVGEELINGSINHCLCQMRVCCDVPKK